MCNPKSAIRNPKSAAPVIGLLGGLGAGKTTVAQMFAEEGCRVVDADRIAHEVLQQADVKDQVRESFGDEVFGPDGAVDRDRLGRQVFADAGRRQILERIVHPPILARMRQAVEAAGAAAPAAVVIDAPLILEKGLAGWCDYMVYVKVPAEVRYRRLRQARGWSPSEVQRREASQISLKNKRGRADYIIDNSASPEHTLEQVRRILVHLGAR
ncbi:MAG: dephospho-CoA kinase [Planctomycetota bacterium]|nr:dephospho-CoA kinase [Planctomycetota bacterium]